MWVQIPTLNYKTDQHQDFGPAIQLDNFLFAGQLADSNHCCNGVIHRQQAKQKLLINAQVVKENANYKLTLNPEEFYLMNDRWDIAADNYVAFGESGFLIHNLSLEKAGSQVDVHSVNDKFNDDLSIAIRNFNLNDISGVVSAMYQPDKGHG
ncbi:MAG: hypothetical protein IPH20_21515 [Bacteroidales bacterium]|nr:hypothetical protein [Bacteroidales bacterium]